MRRSSSPSAKAPPRRRARPAGFGLAIVRAVATAHGGAVVASAPAPSGLTVTVRLPSVAAKTVR